MNPYIRNCKNFSDAMNLLRFKLSVPEYYDTAIPEYFKRPIDIPKPVVNGMEVEWDEYLETHPGEKPMSIIPRPIYRNEDLNRAFTMLSPSEIIDLVINDVPFEFIDFEDIDIVVNIFDGYYNDVKNYIPFNIRLKRFIDNMENARKRLIDVYNAISHYKENMNPNKPIKPLTLIDILDKMKKG